MQFIRELVRQDFRTLLLEHTVILLEDVLDTLVRVLVGPFSLDEVAQADVHRARVVLVHGDVGIDEHHVADRQRNLQNVDVRQEVTGLDVRQYWPVTHFLLVFELEQLAPEATQVLRRSLQRNGGKA